MDFDERRLCGLHATVVGTDKYAISDFLVQLASASITTADHA